MILTLSLGRYFINVGNHEKIDKTRVQCSFNMDKKIYQRILKLSMLGGVTVKEWIDKAIGRVIEGTEEVYYEQMVSQLSHLLGDNELPKE